MFVITSRYRVTTNDIIRNLKILIMLWYVIITILLTPALSTERKSSKAFPSVRNAECYYKFEEKGKFSPQFKQQCDKYYINIDFETKINIINLTMSIQEIRNETNYTQNTIEFSIKVEIYETTVYTDGKEDILQAVWEENQNVVSVERNYLSRTSGIYIVISSTGNYTTNYDVTFSFDEIKHSLRIVDNYSAEGEIEEHYPPNSIRLYRLIAEPNKKWEGIEITIEYLSITKEIGEYLLIGEGTNLFESQDYLPLFLTNIMQNSTFYIGNSSAYVAFVSGPFQKVDNRIKLSWGREEAQTSHNIKEDPLGVLNSSLICFYNFSSAIKEYEKKEDEQFKLFRQNFAEVIKAHKKDKNIDSLDETSVKLFGHPTKVWIDSINSSALAILLKIMYEGKSIFTWNELQEIIGKFEQETNTFLEYKVGKCPLESKELPYADNWSILIYAMAPLFGFIALMIWAWKQNIFSQKCTPEKEEKLCLAPPVLVEPNPYEMTVPKICLYDGDCRRGTLIQGSSQMEIQERDEGDDEIVVEMNVIPSTSRESDTLTRYLTGRRNRQRPSIQSLIDKKEKLSEESHDKTMNIGTESEHLYDSVSNNKEIDETKL